MSGHSKFANIKHKKEKNDAARGKVFTMIGREIAVAVKEGGPDPNNNGKLREVIAKAKASNMPNDTIERGIKKAAGDVNSVNFVTVTYEGYGPGGTAIIVNALTDNKNRTAANVRNCFSKGQGSIGAQGCVSYMFDERGQIIVAKEEYETDPDEFMMDAQGPVLIEVNCRPAGAFQKYTFQDKVMQNHETAVSLDSYLMDKEQFGAAYPERMHLKQPAIVKQLCLEEPIFVKRAKLTERLSKLESFDYAIEKGENCLYPKTTDLDSNGGIIYLTAPDVAIIEQDLKTILALERDGLDELFDWS